MLADLAPAYALALTEQGDPLLTDWQGECRVSIAKAKADRETGTTMRATTRPASRMVGRRVAATLAVVASLTTTMAACTTNDSPYRSGVAVPQSPPLPGPAESSPTSTIASAGGATPGR